MGNAEAGRQGNAVARGGALTILRNRWPTAVALLLFVAWRPDEQFRAAEPDLFIAALLLFFMGAIYVPWGAFRDELKPRWLLWVQAVGLFGFGLVALTALDVDADVARYLLAAGWLAHGVWDAVHFVANRVVPRQWSEFCGLIDLAAGSAMLWAALA